jgi:short-subunit dehydrogenase
VVAPGIGKAIAQKLAKQGLNVVLVALGDDTLLATHEEMQSEFPSVEIRKVQPP